MTGSAQCGAVVPRGTNPGLRHSASKTRVNALMAPSGLRAQAKGAARHALGRAGRVAAIFLFTMSNSAVFFVPAARCCARVLLLSFPSTPTRGERSAERREFSVVALVTRDRPRLTRRGARPAGRARLSALHRGDFGPGAALPSPAFPPDPFSELLAARS